MPRYVCDCGSGCVLVLVIAGRDEASEPKLHQRRDHDWSQMGTAVMSEGVPYLLLQMLQAHGLACEPRDEVAHRLCRRTQPQATKQVEQLFEHLPPTGSQKLPLAALHRRCRRRPQSFRRQ